MKTNQPSLKKIKKYPARLSIILLLFVFINPACKLSYDDISLGSYTDGPGEIQGFTPDSYGYIIYDTAAEKIVKAHNSNTEFTPASVTKIFTALFAEEILGNDYTFPTTLSYNGDISDNILTGDLYLKGSGDPELSLSELLSIVESLKIKKIRELKGKFCYDETAFASRDMLDKDMPCDAYYNAGISPLTFNSNIIYALQRPGSNGKISSADLLPSLPAFGTYIYQESLPYPFLKFKYAGGREIWGLPDKYLWDSRQQLPVKHPGLFTAQTFQKLCKIHGIKLPSPVSGQAPSNSKIIYDLKSRPLTAIIKNMLFTSNNMTAELLYTAASMEYSGRDNSEKKIKAMEDFYSSNFTGLEWKNFRIANASGLTNINKATPAQTTAILLFIEKMNKENFKLEDILPLSGWDGTMKGRLDQPEAAFRVYGKTGSIFYVSGLAGIFYARSGKRYIFTVYVNDSARRMNYDAKNDKTAEDLNNGGAWTKKASSAIDRFIIKMIEEL